MLVAAITVYAGMFYVTGTHYSYMNNQGVSWFFLLLLLFPNIVFFSYWVMMMRIEILKELHKLNMPKLFRVLAFEHAEVFYEKYMKQDDAMALEQEQKILTKEEIEAKAAMRELTPGVSFNFVICIL